MLTNNKHFRKTMSEPIRVWLWFVYKITENDCCLRLFPEFIQTQKRYSNSFDKITILQKQPSRGVLKKRCSENIEKIYRRTPMPKCNFNKIAKQLQHSCSPVNLLHICRTPFSRNTSGWLLLYSNMKTTCRIKEKKILLS